MFRLLNEWRNRLSFRYCIQNRLRPTHQQRRKSHKRHFSRFTVTIVHFKTMLEAKQPQLISSNSFFVQMQTSLLMLWYTIMMLKSLHWNCITSERKVKWNRSIFSRNLHYQSSNQSNCSSSNSRTNNVDRRDLCVIHFDYLRHYSCENTQQQCIFAWGWIIEEQRQTHASQGIYSQLWYLPLLFQCCILSHFDRFRTTSNWTGMTQHLQ